MPGRPIRRDSALEDPSLGGRELVVGEETVRVELRDPGQLVRQRRDPGRLNGRRDRRRRMGDATQNRSIATRYAGSPRRCRRNRCVVARIRSAAPIWSGFSGMPVWQIGQAR
jgi:hypothetical protein